MLKNKEDKLVCSKCGSENLNCPNDGYIHCLDCGYKLTVIETLVIIMNSDKN